MDKILMAVGLLFIVNYVVKLAFIGALFHGDKNNNIRVAIANLVLQIREARFEALVDIEDELRFRDRNQMRKIVNIMAERALTKMNKAEELAEKYSG